jgi:hypothetical protein
MASPGFKRSLLFIVVLLLAAAAAGGFFLLKGKEQAASPAPAKPDASDSVLLRGKWHEVRPNAAQTLTAEQKAKMAKLESLSYLAGYNEAPARSGVTVNDTAKAYKGVNLVMSGHGPEAMLMDMTGKTLHVWRLPYTEARKKFPGLRKPMDGPGPFTFRRARVLENGDLLAIYEGFGLIKLRKDSVPFWAFTRAAHHDLEVTPEGQVVVLSRRARVVQRLDPDEPALLDYVSWLNYDGELARDLSLLDAFERSKFAGLLKGMRTSGDIFHTNTVKVLDGSHSALSPIFSKGNLLISVLHLDTVAIVDPEAQAVVWAQKGGWSKQHEPVLLPSGKMLVFDNNKGGKHSRVLEFDPLTGEQVWAYEGGKDGAFYSAECGVAQRLANGNTLIIESLNGRAFEVTPDKKIVWEYYNPYRAGEKAELIATLFDVVRLGPDFKLDWLEEGEEEAEDPTPSSPPASPPASPPPAAPGPPSASP